MQKSEVYSWRVTPTTKAALEDRARRSGKSLGSLLEEIVEAWLRERAKREEADSEHQKQMHARTARCFGTFASGEGRRAERARAVIRARLREKNA